MFQYIGEETACGSELDAPAVTDTPTEFLKICKPSAEGRTTLVPVIAHALHAHSTREGSGCGATRPPSKRRVATVILYSSIYLLTQ